MPFITRLQLTDVLSFGGKHELELGALNVLIGANGSGKSNLVEVLALLQALPEDANRQFRDGGGFHEWVWKGPRERASSLPGASVAVDFTLPFPSGSITYDVRFFGAGETSPAMVSEERATFAAKGTHRPILERSLRKGVVMWSDDEATSIDATMIDPEFSILAQVRDPRRYPELHSLSHELRNIQLHRNWVFGRGNALRRPQRTDLDGRRISTAYDNLALILQRLRKDASTRRRLIEEVRALSPDFEDFDVAVDAGTITILVQERGWATPAARLSDGTLRWLSLLAILLDPSPPPIIAIEEPELGLHPDLIVRLASILKEARARTQLVITTHSDILIDAIGDPAALLVFEKENGITRVTRPDGPEVREWLKKYSLGRLWLDGEIGGKRW